jgi:adenylosuccinate lyase
MAEASACPAARYLHWGLTLDVLTLFGHAPGQPSFWKRPEEFLQVLKRRVWEHPTLTGYRTHGMHAEPITFGLTLPLACGNGKKPGTPRTSKKDRLRKISGAVGTYAHLSPAVEAYVAKGLKPAPISSQIIQRDRHAEYFLTLALIALPSRR